MERSRSVPSPLAQLALPSVRSSSRASLSNQTKNRAALFQFTLQPNKKQSHSVPAYQTQNRMTPFLESKMERIRSTRSVYGREVQCSEPLKKSQSVAVVAFLQRKGHGRVVRV
jgi:hypothetical protein